MLPLTGATIRVFLHVAAAAVWVAATLAAAWLEPRARRSGADELWAVADGIRSAAWAAYLVVWATGIANLVTAESATQSSRYGASVVAKLALVAVSGAGFWALRDRESASVVGWLGASAAVAALGALLVGVQLGAFT